MGAAVVAGFPISRTGVFTFSFTTNSNSRASTKAAEGYWPDDGFTRLIVGFERRGEKRERCAVGALNFLSDEVRDHFLP